MPRTISVNLEASFGSSHMTITTLIHILSRDGNLEFFFTTCNTPVTYLGDTYTPLESVSGTAVTASSDLAIDNIEVSGILGDAIQRTDMVSDLFNGALVEIMRVDYENLGYGHVTTFKGYITEVLLEDGKYLAEVSGISHRLNQVAGAVTAATCRCRRFGDLQCKMVAASYQVSKNVGSVTSAHVITFTGDANASGYYDYGILKFTTGANAGIEREVKSHTKVGSDAQLTLRSAFPFTVEVGDTATLEAGCDRTFDSCLNKFNNAINFRGEPHLPGNEQMMKVGRAPS